MAIDQDTLNTLKNIERILAGSSSTTGSSNMRRVAGSTPRTEAAQARSEEESQRQTRKVYAATSTAVDRLGFSSNRTAESLKGLERSGRGAGIGLDDLTGNVTKTIASFAATRAELGKVNIGETLTSLQKAIEESAASMRDKQLKRSDTEGVVESMSSFETLIGRRVNPSMTVFNTALRKATAALSDSWRGMREASSSQGADTALFGKNVNIAIAAIDRRGGVGAQFEILRRRLVNLNNAMRTTGSLVRRGGGGGGGGGGSGPDEDDIKSRGKANTSEAPQSRINKLLNNLLDPFKIAFVRAAESIGHNIVKLVDDAFQTTGARGFGTFGSNFLTLSTSALAAGMSLQEYVKILDANEGAVSRFGSFKAFDEQLDVGRDQLKKFGIFGMEATELTATMVGSAQSLGVPVSDLSKSIDGQIGIFEQLRKTTGITAEQFMELSKTVAESEVVQRELIGLNPADRAARQTDITQSAALGKSLGLTAQQSSALSQALLAQRKATVKDRFQARGTFAQAGSLVNLDPDDLARGQELISKKNKTSAENDELVAIAGKLESRMSEIEQNGGPGAENQVQVMRERLSQTSLGPLLDASIAAKAARDSGNQLKADGSSVNSGLNKTLSGFEQSAGTIVTYLEGIYKSPLVQLGMGAVVAGLTALQISNSYALLQLPARIAMALRGAGLGSAAGLGPDGMGPPAPEGMGNGAKGGAKAGRLGRMAGGLGRIAGTALMLAPAIIENASALSDLSKAQDDQKKGVEGANEAEGAAIGKGIGASVGAAVGLVLSGFIGAFTGGLGLLATGVITSITTGLGAWAGSLFGGWLKSDSAIDKNTKEVKKQTDEMVKARRDTAGSDVISSSNLSSIASNVLQTGIADAAVTDAEVKKAQDAVNKANGTSFGQSTDATPSTPSKPSNVAVVGGVPMVDDYGRTIELGTPSPQTRSSVNQAALNTPTPDATTPTTPSTASAVAAATAPVADQGSTLSQILQTLQQMLVAENTQSDLAGQLLRSPAFATRLPDNQTMVSRAIT